MSTPHRRLPFYRVPRHVPLCLLLLAGASASEGHAALTVMAYAGQPAPGFPAGYVITGFAEPPSIASGVGCAALRLNIDGPGSDDPQAIYLWHPTLGLKRVAVQGQSYAFATGLRSLAFLETPAVDESCRVAFTATLDVGRGLVVWDPVAAGAFDSTALYPAACTGQSVNIPCETVAGASCGPVAGILTTLGGFNGRKAATFRDGRAFFRAVVDPDTVGGLPDAIWTWEVGTGLVPIANGFLRADGVNYALEKPFYSAFTNLADCGELFGLADISLNAPKTVYLFDATGTNHTLITRSYAPDMTPRIDFHCQDVDYVFGGGVSGAPFDGNIAGKGVWYNGSQIYSQGVTAATDVPGATLGAPRGVAFSGSDYVLFAAKLVGGAANGKTGLWYSDISGSLWLAAYEGLTNGSGTARIEKIYTAHTTSGSPLIAILHVQERILATNQLVEAIFLSYPSFTGGALLEVLSAGLPLQVSGQSVVITGFRLLGRDFVDTVVTGNGADGLPNPFNDNGELALVIDYVADGSGPRGEAVTIPGSGVIRISVDLPIFIDDFETGNTDRWSSHVP